MCIRVDIGGSMCVAWLKLGVKTTALRYAVRMKLEVKSTFRKITFSIDIFLLLFENTNLPYIQLI